MGEFPRLQLAYFTVRCKLQLCKAYACVATTVCRCYAMPVTAIYLLRLARYSSVRYVARCRRNPRKNVAVAVVKSRAKRQNIQAEAQPLAHSAVAATAEAAGSV